MASNPLIDQGSLNRLRASLTFASNAALNVTPAFLGKEALNMNVEGATTTMIDTQTGMVTSLEPFVRVRVMAHLLRTQGLSAAYKAQIESNCNVGQLTIRPDAATLPDYTLYNCAITATPSLGFAGQSPDFTVEITGSYYVNNSAWNI